MEASGKFHRAAHRRLHEAGDRVPIVNPLRARLFAQPVGALAKTDTVDARMLAICGRMASLKPTPPLSESTENLKEIVPARESAVATGTALHNQLASTTRARSA